MGGKDRIIGVIDGDIIISALTGGEDSLAKWRVLLLGHGMIDDNDIFAVRGWDFLKIESGVGWIKIGYRD